ncbi:hypothetical protein EVG20_g7962 [Dentipellis fragilis]|uniref:Uncharacterized protein n=1 Tax=Dentipellis fragilis TaxID=205917 RepID=A0A4Y9Y9I1_9AGAM|nr:hypothetical protein EVG20_g7962 [Dentipellis fragilis]
MTSNVTLTPTLPAHLLPAHSLLRNQPRKTIPDEPTWRLQDSVRFTGLLAMHGVDSLDVSSSGADPAQKMGPRVHHILEADYANVVFVECMLQKNPGLVCNFAEDLSVQNGYL